MEEGRDVAGTNKVVRCRSKNSSVVGRFNNVSAEGREGRRDVGFTGSAHIICFILYLSKSLSEVLSKSHEEGSLCCVPAVNLSRTMRTFEREIWV